MLRLRRPIRELRKLRLRRFVCAPDSTVNADEPSCRALLKNYNNGLPATALSICAKQGSFAMLSKYSVQGAGRSQRRLGVILSIAVLCGCGSQLIQPDRSTQPAPAGAQLQSPQVSSTTQADLQNLPRVSASSAMRTDGRPPSGTYHEVRMGDTLSAIARAFGTSVEQLLKSNGLDREATLQPGQLIYIPK